MFKTICSAEDSRKLAFLKGAREAVLNNTSEKSDVYHKKKSEVIVVYRIFVEKKRELAHEANALLKECNDTLGIKGLSSIRIINRYDAEDISEEDFNKAVKNVLANHKLTLPIKNLIAWMHSRFLLLNTCLVNLINVLIVLLNAFKL